MTMNPKITIPNVQPTLGPVIKNTEPMIEAMKGYEATTAKEADEVTNLITHAKKTLKELEANEKSITQPLHEAKKAAHDLFRRPKALLTEFITLGKGCLERRHERLEAEREKLLSQASESFASGNAQAGREAASAAVQVQVEAPKGLSFKDVWAFEIVAPDQVDRALCSPDDQKIRSKLAFLPLSAEAPEWPGLRVFKKKVTTNRN